METNGIARVVRTASARAAHLPFRDKRPIHRNPEPAREATSLPYRVGDRTSAVARPERNRAPAEAGPKRDPS